MGRKITEISDDRILVDDEIVLYTVAGLIKKLGTNHVVSTLQKHIKEYGYGLDIVFYKGAYYVPK